MKQLVVCLSHVITCGFLHFKQKKHRTNVEEDHKQQSVVPNASATSTTSATTVPALTETPQEKPKKLFWWRRKKVCSTELNIYSILNTVAVICVCLVFNFIHVFVPNRRPNVRLLWQRMWQEQQLSPQTRSVRVKLESMRPHPPLSLQCLWTKTWQKIKTSHLLPQKRSMRLFYLHLVSLLWLDQTID